MSDGTEHEQPAAGDIAAGDIGEPVPATPPAAAAPAAAAPAAAAPALAAQAAAAPAGPGDAGRGGHDTWAAGRPPGKSDPGVEKTRAITGLIAVIAGDVAIALAAILGIVYMARSSGTSSATAQIAAILSSAFTAIGTMTTAYFGIKSISNTAKNLAGPPTGDSGSPASPPGPPPAPQKPPGTA